MNELAPGLRGFGCDLEAYAERHEQFCRMVRGTANEVFRRGGDAADVGVQLSGLLGWLGGLLVATGGSYLAGKRLEQEIEAEGEALERHFEHLLESYDEATRRLRIIAIGILERYCD